ILERGVQVVDVRAVMLVVVDLHRSRVNVRLERVERVRQGGQGELRHRVPPEGLRIGEGSRSWEGTRPFPSIVYHASARRETPGARRGPGVRREGRRTP